MMPPKIQRECDMMEAFAMAYEGPSDGPMILYPIDVMALDCSVKREAADALRKAGRVVPR